MQNARVHRIEYIVVPFSLGANRRLGGRVGSFAPNKNAQMAQYLRIRCIVKTDRTSAHERIDSVGGVKPDGTPWKLTQDKAISYIEDGTYVFYIERPGGHRVDVIVAASAYGSYLRTVSDKEQPSKLLSLPTCPEI